MRLSVPGKNATLINKVLFSCEAYQPGRTTPGVFLIRARIRASGGAPLTSVLLCTGRGATTFRWSYVWSVTYQCLAVVL